MDDTEQREDGEKFYRLVDVEGMLDTSSEVLETELSEFAHEIVRLYAHNALTAESEASTRAHPLASARPVLPAPALPRLAERWGLSIVDCQFRFNTVCRQ